MFSEFFRKKNGNWKDDTLSGLTVALALVPEAIAFSFLAGVSPVVGLWSAVFVGFITASLGGRPGMISGATGAIAIVAAKAVTLGNEAGGEEMGMKYLFATLILAGLIQFGAGILKLGRFIRLVPHPVMIGFVNGLAIVIGLGQLGFFKEFAGLAEDGSRLMAWLPMPKMALMIGLVVASMAIIHFLPKLTKAVPSALAAIVLIGVLGYFGLFDARTIADVLKDGGGDGTLSNDFPLLADLGGLPWGWEFLKTILPIALTIALVGLIESLMTMQLIDEMTETRGHGNRECLAQGGANVLSGLFGGMGGCAMIGQSLINIRSGGRGRTSGIVAALALAAFVLFAGPVIVQIPIAALVGVMFMVVIGTFEWSSLRTFGKVPVSEILVIAAVTLVTVFLHNLALAVFVGVILSALVFAWESSRHVHVELVHDTEEERIYSLEGLLYFGSVRDFADHFQARSDVPSIVIDFARARVCDLSGIEAINALTERYRKAGKRLRLRHLSKDCARMLNRADALINIEMAEDDPDYLVARIRPQQD
ncbi:SulP family inorganic anion transporter [Haloferula sp. A504]|uniref:SulP family inorganic anion transporter n=1 Tax=Haloferula sp. A504 TaxID=3373601 RepID=UPI0031C7152E|nr:SulP family inorganic anion transporter [Verrucomicrobiaceae bacterium E54]